MAQSVASANGRDGLSLAIASTPSLQSHGGEGLSKRRRPMNPLEATRKLPKSAHPPVEHSYAEPIRRKRVRPETRMEFHFRTWERYLRRYGRAFPADHPIHTDIRFWEARRCRIRCEDDTPESLSNFLFFFALHPFTRLDIYRMAQLDRSRAPFFGHGDDLRRPGFVEKSAKLRRKRRMVLQEEG